MIRSPLLLLCAGVSGCTEVDPAAVRSWARPDNSWSISEPPDDLLGEGFEVGEVIPDLRLVDQHGDTVSTWQFWGDVVLLTVSAVWCNPCRDLAVDAEQIATDFGTRGVIHLTVLEEDAGGLTPDVDDALAWAGAFGSESPVLIDPDRAMAPVLLGSYPAVLLVNRELVVVERAREFELEDLEDLVASELQGR